jgi:hypothetical protein
MATLDRRRRQIQDEADYERNRPTALDDIARTAKAELAFARNANSVDIWSGRALNTLLNSINKSSQALNKGPKIELDDESLRNINLTDNAIQGNIGMLKNNGQLFWPRAFQEAQFDKPRKRLDRNLKIAVTDLKSKEPVERGVLNDIEADMKDLEEQLASKKTVDSMSVTNWMEARKYLNQLRRAVRSLSDPRAANYFNNTWTAKGRTVAELVSHLQKEGLRFAPAAPGDEAAYNALYQALRSFDAGLQVASR